MDYTIIKNFFIPSESNNYRSRFLQSNALLCCVIFLLVLKIGATLISINFPQNIFFADVSKSALENLVNQTRQSLGLKALVENEKLNKAANLKAQNMIENQYFAHTSPSGISPWSWFLRAGYKYKYAGENLAIGFFDSSEVYEAWLNSPSHKANIVNPRYTEVGTAVLNGFGSNNTVIVVQEFASPLPAKAVTTATVKPVVNNNVVKAPAQTNNQKQEMTTKEQVLSQATEQVTNNLPSKIVNSVLYNYDDILQSIIYGVSLVVIGVLLMLIFLNFEISFKRQLVYRAVLIVILLSLATAFNREVIISLIPHQILI